MDKLNKATVALLETPEVKQRYLGQGMDPIPSTVEAFSAKLKSETGKWTRVIQATGTRVD